MLKTLILFAVQLSLSILAPKAGKTVEQIAEVAKTALPFVEQVAKSSANNDTKFEQAVAMTKQEIGLEAIVGDVGKENIIESGVQLAYSILKARGK